MDEKMNRQKKSCKTSKLFGWPGKGIMCNFKFKLIVLLNLPLLLQACATLSPKAASIRSLSVTNEDLFLECQRVGEVSATSILLERASDQLMEQAATKGATHIYNRMKRDDGIATTFSAMAIRCDADAQKRAEIRRSARIANERLSRDEMQALYNAERAEAERQRVLEVQRLAELERTRKAEEVAEVARQIKAQEARAKVAVRVGTEVELCLEDKPKACFSAAKSYIQLERTSEALRYLSLACAGSVQTACLLQANLLQAQQLEIERGRDVSHAIERDEAKAAEVRRKKEELAAAEEERERQFKLSLLEASRQLGSSVADTFSRKGQEPIQVEVVEKKNPFAPSSNNSNKRKCVGKYTRGLAGLEYHQECKDSY